MYLTIDAGNTFVKLLIFRDHVPVFRDVRKGLTIRYLQSIFRKFEIDGAMISSVINLDAGVRKFLREKKIMEFTSGTAIPLKNKYKTPQTLGKDRLANAVAAAFLFPGKDVLVIDAGTCLKFDFVEKGKNYLGGSISPGVDMRFEALHLLTDKLPLTEAVPSNKLIGNTTVTAIQSGVFNGITGEIESVILRYRKLYPSLRVILTGGDAELLAGQLNLSIFAASDLVNLGLNEIIEYNRNK
ncbi:MAG: type III pantothenate kinase [Bacteroidia bacterium]